MLFRSDRKSTRLNSSHLVISYAVFCLKKNARRSTSARRRAAPRRRKRQLRRISLRRDQRSLDVIGLGLVALAVFMGCVLFAHWSGRRVGNRLPQALACL